MCDGHLFEPALQGKTSLDNYGPLNSSPSLLHSELELMGTLSIVYQTPILINGFYVRVSSVRISE
jgi:hypothetical protein